MTETTKKTTPEKTTDNTAEKPAAEDNSASTDTKTDKADAQSASAKKAPAKKASAKKSPAKKTAGEKKGGGHGLLLTVAALAVIGGGVTIAWPQLAPYAEPYVSNVRGLLGLSAPAPTQTPTATETPAPAVEPAAESAPEVVAESDTAPETMSSPESSVEAAPATDVVTEPAVEPEAPSEPTVTEQDTPSADGGEVEALAARLNDLESQIDNLYKTDQSDELARALDGIRIELADLRGRLDAVEQAPRVDPTASAQALVLAVTQLRARLMSDESYSAELAALERIADRDDVVADALARLRTNADVGVPTEGALTARFEAMARDILHARAQGADAGWLGRVKDSLGGLVTVRRTDPENITDEVERAVAVAEAALQLGDLNGAVEALSALQGTPGDAAAAWLGDARARLDAEAALEILHNHALAVLSSADGA